MANFLPQPRVDAILSGAQAGMSLRWIARTVGISKNTVKRYLPLAGEDRSCPCGGPAGHQGWCKWRYAQSPARQAFHAARRKQPRIIVPRVERLNLAYPFMVRDNGSDEHRLLRTVNAAVPKYLDPHMRADICQDLIAGLLCGDFSENNLTQAVKETTRRYNQMFSRFGHVSLDAPMPGTDDLRLIDIITDEDSLWRRVA